MKVFLSDVLDAFLPALAGITIAALLYVFIISDLMETYRQLKVFLSEQNCGTCEYFEGFEGVEG